MSDDTPETPDDTPDDNAPTHLPPRRPNLHVIDNATDAARKAATTEQEIEALLQDGVNDEAIALKLSELEQEHRDLDAAIGTLEERMPYDRLTLQRMKKRKLLLKDKIFELKDKLEPDIIA